MDKYKTTEVEREIIRNAINKLGGDEQVASYIMNGQIYKLFKAIIKATHQYYNKSKRDKSW